MPRKSEGELVLWGFFLVLAIYYLMGCTTPGGPVIFEDIYQNVSAEGGDIFVRKPIEQLPQDTSWTMKGDDAGTSYNAILVTPSDGTYGERMVDLSGGQSVSMPADLHIPYQFEFKQTPFGGFATETIFDSTAPFATYRFRAGGGQEFTLFVSSNISAFSTTNTALTFSSAIDFPMTFQTTGDLGYISLKSDNKTLIGNRVNNIPPTLGIYQIRNSAPTSGTRIADFNFMSDPSSADKNQTGATIRAVADGTWSTTENDYPTRVEVHTQCDGGTDCLDTSVITFDSNQNVSVPNDLNVNRVWWDFGDYQDYNKEANAYLYYIGGNCINEVNATSFGGYCWNDGLNA